MRSDFIGWHVMQVDRYCWKACGSCGLAFHKNICSGSTFPVDGHVLQTCAKAVTI